MPAFDQQEYRARTARLRQRMAERGMDALLVMNESNLHYLTGYEGFSDYVPQLALICQNEEDPWLILREMDVACATASSYLPHSRLLSYPDTSGRATGRRGSRLGIWFASAPSQTASESS